MTVDNERLSGSSLAIKCLPQACLVPSLLMSLIGDRSRHRAKSKELQFVALSWGGDHLSDKR